MSLDTEATEAGAPETAYLDRTPDTSETASLDATETDTRPFPPLSPCGRGVGERGVNDRHGSFVPDTWSSGQENEARHRATARIAILALTRPAIRLAGRVMAALPTATLAVPARFAPLAAEVLDAALGQGREGTVARSVTAPGAEVRGAASHQGRDTDAADAVASLSTPSGVRILGYEGALRDRMGELFAGHDGLIGILSLGALVRLVAPHLRDKTRDPAVVALDEAGRFVIPMLSGHLGGANELALRLAAALGATPVLTTASDCQRSLAVDLLGRELGWRIQASRAALLRASAAVVNGEPVALVQEAGVSDWWSGHAGGRVGPPPGHLLYPQPINGTPADGAETGPPPIHLLYAQRLEDVDPDAVAAVLWIGRRAPPAALAEALGERLIRYRPPAALALGLGCDRGTPAASIARAVEEALASVGLTAAAVTAVGSIDLKADEPGLLDHAAGQGWTIRFYRAAQLASVPVPNPSERVRAIVGTPSVSEAAALLAAAGVPADSLRDAQGAPPAGPPDQAAMPDSAEVRSSVACPESFASSLAAACLLVEKYRYRGPDGRSVTVSVASMDDSRHGRMNSPLLNTD